MSADHEPFMRLALAQAAFARAAGEVPVGAVVVLDGGVVGRGYNHPIGDLRSHRPRGGPRAARGRARDSGNYRLTGAILYVTVEPCLMCVGAIVHARVATRRLRRRRPEGRGGALAPRPNALPLNHRFEVVEGVLGRRVPGRSCRSSSARAGTSPRRLG